MRRPSSSDTSGFQPASSRARVLSQSRRSTSLPAGRSRLWSVTNSAWWPVICIRRATRSPTEISRPEPTLVTWPTVWSAAATAMNPAAVSSRALHPHLAAGAEHVVGADHVGLHVALGGFVAVGDADEGGQMEDDVDAVRRLQHPARVAHVAREDLDVVRPPIQPSQASRGRVVD